MERLLLWLDELDDCLTMSFHGVGRIRRGSLQAGLMAALGLLLVDTATRSGVLANTLTMSAAVSVLVWTAASAAELAVRRSGARRGRRLETS